MMTRRPLFVLVASVAFCGVLGGGNDAQAAPPVQDVLVQPPNIVPPQRGSLAGTLSRVAFGASDLARGAYNLPLALDLPADRGPLLIGVVPSYSPETGIGEWGTGWQAELSIRRFRPRGEVDFITDDFTSPWGRLAAGLDGYYPAGLTSVVRVTASGSGWSAVTSDGTRFSFEAGDAVSTPRGTYEWMLSRVDNIYGDSTTLQWNRNASGRPYLVALHWGGRNDGTQYQATFDYETVPTPFVSYASGSRLVLDQRVICVTVGVRQVASYSTRWSYSLAYQESTTGPAFYLHSITKTYASGQRDPAVTYDYDLGAELWSSAGFEHVTGLDDFLSVNGGLMIQPDHAATLDLEQNGLTDLEIAFDQTTLRQTENGFVAEPLPPTLAGESDPNCRPAASLSNMPRQLARMHGDANEPQVVVIQEYPLGDAARVLVCDRLGRPIYDQDIPGSWELGANTRLADLDMDQRPDIVRVSYGQIDVLRNISDGPQSLGFAPGSTMELSPAVDPVASWILDFNGDGRADLLVRHSGGVVVWLGTGGGEFEAIGTEYGFFSVGGQSLSNFSDYQFSLGDFNGDGLSDVILTQGPTAALFLNRGGSFVETPIPALINVPGNFGYPIVADLSGSGNEEAIFLADDRAMAIQLTSPSTGLLRSADDGKGTLLRFTYGRVRPAPGIVRRYSVLTRLTVESSGYDAVSYSYDYGEPVLHTRGKYLVGFASVEKHSPALRERLALFNDDDVSGVHRLSEATDDRTPGIGRFSEWSYSDGSFHGVRWLRPLLVEIGYRSPDGLVNLSTTTRYTTYEREHCPTVTVTTGPNGELVATAGLASVAAIPDDLHCLPASQSLSGTHADASLDFNYMVDLARNDFGQIEHVTQLGPSVDLLVLQNITYDANHRLYSIGAPGRGTTVASYDPLGRLTQLTDPLGLVTSVDSRDAVNDAPLELRTARPDAPSTAFFHYDGKERLQSSWDDFSGTSQSQPGVSYAYQDATSSMPGRIDTQTLADAVTGVSRQAADLVAADGEPLVAGAWLGDHFALGMATVANRNALTTRSSFIGTMASTELAALTSADIRTRGALLAETIHAGFGHAIQVTATQQAGVVGTTTTELVLGSTELVTRVTQPGGFVAESATDAAGKLVRKTDENGVTHRYVYDALGRLVRLDTPDGAHTVTFDGFGRPKRVTRDGIGAVSYDYDPASGLLVRKQRFDASGTIVDTSDTRYDSTGRPVRVSQSTSGAESDLQFGYDGQLGSSSIVGQLGRLTSARGDGWERTSLFDPLGRAYEQHVTLTAWRDLTSEKIFRSDGAVASDTLTITDPGGVVKFSSTKETVLDGLGRISAVKIDGAVLYTLSYDPEGRIFRADFTSGEAIVFDYDSVTHARNGHQVAAPDSSGAVHWERDRRGLVNAETYVNGSTTTRRGYTYDGRRALTSATTPTDVASYTYTASGLPDSISDAAGTRSVHHTSQTLAVGDIAYTWDAAGRVIGKDDWTFDYGPNGQLAHATHPGRRLDFVYDDSNNRLLKRVDGVPVRADVAGGVLTEDHFIELVSIGGVVAGVLDNGRFTALLTDPRGTPFAGPDGTPDLASPYGVRVSHLGLAEVIDYARLGWDPDLDVVRMGVRDYDAKLSQFLTPDPLYFEDLEKCQGSPLQCSLYGYAGGNPLSFVDPTGLGFWADFAADFLEAAATVGGGFVGGVFGGPAGAVVGAGLARGFVSAPADLIRGLTPTVGRQLTAIAQGGMDEAGGEIVSSIGSMAFSAVGKILRSKALSSAASEGEVVWRTMTRAHADELVATGRLAATRETFISPTRSFAEGYDGVLVELQLQAGTIEKLAQIGVRDSSSVVTKAYPTMPPVSKGWTSTSAFFKGESGQINIGLGRGDALDVFNANIKRVNVVSF